MGNIRKLKPVNLFANLHDNGGSEYGELRSDEEEPSMARTGTLSRARSAKNLQK